MMDLISNKFKPNMLLIFFSSAILVISAGANAAISPFYPIPAYLSSKAETIRPNVMLLVDSSGSMTNIRVDGDTRINVARRAFTDLVSNNRDLVRWGFSTFHVTDFVPVADDNADPVLDKIARMVAPNGTGTPTMPIYYQLIRYFQGLPPTSVVSDRGMIGDWQNRLNDDTTRSPLQYRCQKNFIISLSDGGATGASTVNEYTGDTVFNSLAKLAGSLPAYTEKAFNHDFKTALDGLDAEGQSWDDQNYPLQNIITYTIGFGSGMPAADQLNLQQAADNGGGQYYVAGNSAELVASLQNALANIAAMTRPPSPPAYVDDPRASSSGAIAVNFSSKKWTSDLTVYATNSDGSIDTNVTRPINITSGTGRNLWFKSAVAGNSIVSLRTNPTADLVSTFGVTTADASNNGKLITWLRGSAVESKANETRASLFGDVINSEISVTNKGELFTLGANDGMVHVFKKNALGGYNETFVYMPTLTKRSIDGDSRASETIGQVVPNLTKLNYGEATNGHQYLVDGGSFYRGYTAGTTDGEKHFVVGATGRGGAGAYALDMKQINATGGNSESVIFDVTNGDMNNLGYTVGTPVIAKINDGANIRLVALISNGFFSRFNETTKKGISSGAQGFPSLYALNLEAVGGEAKGKLWRELTIDSVPSSFKNGLSSPTAVSVFNNDGITDFVYAGDLNGDLYRIDLRSGRAHKDFIVKIFSGDPSKPITSAPAVYKNKEGKFTIVFGTGSLLEEPDNTSTLQQTVYGIVDDFDVTGNLAANTAPTLIYDTDLLSQQIIVDGDNRMITTNTPDPADPPKKGWKLDLSANTGERVVYQPIVNGGTVFFTTQVIIPPADGLLCAVSSGSGYLMSVDAETGGQPQVAKAHFGFKNTSGDFYAGKKIRGYVAGLGGMILSSAGKLGTNEYGQSVAGLVSDAAPPKYEKNTCYSINYAGETNGSECFYPERTSISSNVRTLSWREIF